MAFYSFISRRFPGLPDRIRAYIDLFRPFTLLAPLLGCLAFGLFALLVDEDLELGWETVKLLIYGSVTLVLLNCASNTWNQANEVELDRINKPTRPIPAGRVDEDEAAVVAGILYFLALVRAVTINPWFAVGVTLLIVITVAYSHPKIYLKRRFVINNLTMAVARGYLGPWTAWCLFGDPLHPVIHGACLILAVWTFGSIATKDLPDVVGDRRHGVRTFPTEWGVVRTRGLVAGSVLAPFLMVPAFVRLEYFPQGMLWFLVLIPFPVAIIYLLYSGRDTKSIVENRWSWILMYLMFMAMLLAFPIIFYLV